MSSGTITITQPPLEVCEPFKPGQMVRLTKDALGRFSSRYVNTLLAAQDPKTKEYLQSDTKKIVDIQAMTGMMVVGHVRHSDRRENQVVVLHEESLILVHYSLLELMVK